MQNNNNTICNQIQNELKDASNNESKKDPMDLITQGFTHFCNQILDEGIEDSKQARHWMVSKNPDFEQDVIFNNIFDIIFMIELCKRKQLEQQKIK